MSRILWEEEAEAKFKISSWGTWGCEVSKFDWQYSGKETAYVLEGLSCACKACERDGCEEKSL